LLRCRVQLCEFLNGFSIHNQNARNYPRFPTIRKPPVFVFYTEAGNAIGFALEQPLHVVALPCSALRIFSVYFKTASAYFLKNFRAFRLFASSALKKKFFTRFVLDTSSFFLSVVKK
jgi:hypothetical protein